MLVAQELGARSREAHTAPVVDAAVVRILKLLANARLKWQNLEGLQKNRLCGDESFANQPIHVKSSNLTLQYPSFYESCGNPSKERISPFDLLFASAHVMCIFEAFSRVDRGGDLTKVEQLSRELGSET